MSQSYRRQRGQRQQWPAATEGGEWGVGVRGAAGCVYTPLREPGLTHRDALCMEMRCGDALGGGRGEH